MLRAPPAKHYRVVSLHSGEVWDFATPYDVAMHMWGRDVTAYAVFKHGVRWPRRGGGELGAYERALTRWQPKVKDV